jgi:hypothetical protein
MGTKISAFPAAAALAGAEKLAAVQALADVYVTPAQIRTYVLAALSALAVSGAASDLSMVVSTQTGTAYTAVLGDKNSYIRFTNGAAINFTIPANATVAFPIGTTITICQAGAGSLSVVAAGGVTINSRGPDLTLAGQFASATLVKVATDTWDFDGDL